MNDDTYTPCTKCGRPMKYCKGQCCGKPRGCECKEYGPAVCGVIRQRQPECPYTAVIPSMVVEHADNLKDLCDTFVHVSDLNTTFYIDDKHRTIITWAGPVEYDNYDLVTNSLGLRSQFLIDFANNRGAYYDKVGNYQVFNFGSLEEPPIRLRMEWTNDEGAWDDFVDSHTGMMLDYQDIVIGQSAVKTMVKSFDITNDVNFINEANEAEEFSVSDVFAFLEDGKEVILDNVPLGARREQDNNGVITFSSLPTPCDGIRLYGPGASKTVDDWEVDYISYAGSCVVTNIYYNTPLYITIAKATYIGDESPDPEYYCLVHGFVSYSIGQ